MARSGAVVPVTMKKVAGTNLKVKLLGPIVIDYLDLGVVRFPLHRKHHNPPIIIYPNASRKC